MKYLLSIDLSTNCTGYALFNLENKDLVSYGFLKGKAVKEKCKWRATLKKLEFMAQQILKVLLQYQPDLIVIEEIAGSKNRLSQKTLDMCHLALWIAIEPYLDKVHYFDVSGSDSWRTFLKLKLSDADKLANKEAKKLNVGGEVLCYIS